MGIIYTAGLSMLATFHNPVESRVIRRLRESVLVLAPAPESSTK